MLCIRLYTERGCAPLFTCHGYRDASISLTWAVSATREKTKELTEVNKGTLKTETPSHRVVVKLSSLFRFKPSGLHDVSRMTWTEGNWLGCDSYMMPVFFS